MDKKLSSIPESYINNKMISYLVYQEGMRLSAYKDSTGIITIGIGSTRYSDGSPISIDDKLQKWLIYENKIN